MLGGSRVKLYLSSRFFAEVLFLEVLLRYDSFVAFARDGRQPAKQLSPGGPRLDGQRVFLFRHIGEARLPAGG